MITISKKGKNIYLRKDGRWEGRYVKERINGKTKYGYVFGKSYEEVEIKLDNISAFANIAGLSEAYLFVDLANSYLSFNSVQLKPSSIAKYTNMLNTYLIPRFGNLSVTDITRAHVLQMSQDLLVSGGSKSKGLSPKTVNSILSLLKNILDFGYREKGLQVPDIRNISIKQPQKPLRILSKMEQQQLNQYLTKNITPCHLGILVCMYTGLRIGEICALKWEDIHLSEKYIHVHQTMQRIQIMDESDNSTTIIIQSPKSDCSIRIIPLPEELVNLLMNEKKEDSAYLLTGLDTKFMEPRRLEYRFKKIISECEIENVNFHALRHTFATRCVELGFDIKSLSEILGHANVNITLNRYVHPSMELKKENMDKLSQLLTIK